MSSLNDLIMSAISGVSTVDTEVEKVAHYKEPNNYVSGDIEKLASALEYVAQRGIESFSKVAMHMETSKSGHFGDNPGMKDGFGSSENKSHHPALSNNEAAMSYKPGERNKMIDPTLKSLLSNANSSTIHSSEIVSAGKSKVAEDTKEMLRQAIAAKLVK